MRFGEIAFLRIFAGEFQFCDIDFVLETHGCLKVADSCIFVAEKNWDASHSDGSAIRPLY